MENNYKIPQIQDQRIPVGVHMTTAGTVFLLSTQNSALMISSFDYSVAGVSILTPLYGITYNSTSKLITGGMSYLSPFPTDDSIYMSGSLNNRISMFKFSQKEGSSEWVYSVKDMAGVSTNVILKQMDTYGTLSGGGLVASHFGCAENLGSLSAAVGFVYVEETIGSHRSIQQTWFFNYSLNLRCLNVMMSSSSLARFLIYKEFTYVYYGTLTIGTGTMTYSQIGMNAGIADTLYPKHGILTSSLATVYYVGSLLQINSQTYSPHKVGFISSYPQASCLTQAVYSGSMLVNTTTSFLVYNGQPIFDPTDDYLDPYVDATLEYIVAQGLSATNLVNTTAVLLPDACLAYPIAGTISPGTSWITSPQTYYITASPLILSFTNFTYSQPCSDLTWAYTSSLSDCTALPSAFLSFQELSTGGQFTVTTADESLAGSYNISVKATVGGMYSQQFFFQLDLVVPPTPVPPPVTPPPTTPPTPPPATQSPLTPPIISPLDLPPKDPPPCFQQDPPSLLTIFATDTLTTQLPQVTSSAYTLSLHPLIFSSSPAPHFLQYTQQGRLSLAPLSTDIGEHQLVIKLISNYQTAGVSKVEAKSEYMLTVVVLRKSLHGGAIPQTPKQQEEVPKTTGAVDNQTGNFTNGSNDQYVPSFNKSKPKNGSNTPANIRKSSKFEMSIRKITVTGDVIVFFSREVLIPMNYSSFLQGRELDIQISDRSSPGLIQSWFITDFTAFTMKLKVTWLDPKELTDTDRLVIRVIDNWKFMSMRTLEPIERDAMVQKIIPVQVRSEREAETINGIAGTVATAVTTLVIGTITMNLFLTMLLQQMWGMLNTLQFVLHIPLLSLKLPPNIQLLLTSLFDVINFDFLQTETTIRSIFGLYDQQEYPPYNDRFDMLGYSSSSCIYNLGTPLYMILVYVVVLLVYLVIVNIPIQYKWFLNLKTFLQKLLFLGPPIRFIIEMVLEGCISSIVNLYGWYTNELPTPYRYGDYLSIFLSLVIIILSFGTTIYVSQVLIKNRGNFESEFMQKYFSELTSEQRKLSKGQLIYYSVFIVRRFIFIGIILLMDGQVSNQVIAFLILNLAYLCYSLAYKPLYGQWKFELFNEYCTLLISTMLLWFTDFLDDGLTNFKYTVGGYSFIGIFAFNFIVNFAVIFYQLAVLVIRAIKYRYHCLKQKLKQRKVQKGFCQDSNTDRTHHQRGKVRKYHLESSLNSRNKYDLKNQLWVIQENDQETLQSRRQSCEYNEGRKVNICQDTSLTNSGLILRSILKRNPQRFNRYPEENDTQSINDKRSQQISESCWNHQYNNLEQRSNKSTSLVKKYGGLAYQSGIEAALHEQTRVIPSLLLEDTTNKNPIHDQQDGFKKSQLISFGPTPTDNKGPDALLMTRDLSQDDFDIVALSYDCSNNTAAVSKQKVIELATHHTKPSLLPLADKSELQSVSVNLIQKKQFLPIRPSPKNQSRNFNPLASALPQTIIKSVQLSQEAQGGLSQFILQEQNNSQQIWPSFDFNRQQDFYEADPSKRNRKTVQQNKKEEMEEIQGVLQLQKRRKRSEFVNEK